jgi:hypothetical protein
LFSGILLESGFGESVNTRDQKRPALETLHATFLTLHDENKKAQFATDYRRVFFIPHDITTGTALNLFSFS